MASVMWNHAPAMWSAMEAKEVARPAIGDKQAEDLFAYLYSIRYASMAYPFGIEGLANFLHNPVDFPRADCTIHFE